VVSRSHNDVGECWTAIPSWPYEAGDRGHIRKQTNPGNSSRLVEFRVDEEGNQFATLSIRNKAVEFPVDYVICSAFHGYEPWSGETEVLHFDGLNWNNWQSNLAWNLMMPNRNVQWARVTPHKKSLPYLAKPVWSEHKATPCFEMNEGDILLGCDGNNKVVCFEMLVNPDAQKATRNPFDVVRYIRATANHLVNSQLEIIGEKMSRQEVSDPFEAADRYRRIATMHPNVMWASYLADAAIWIEQLALLAHHKVRLEVKPPERPAQGRQTFAPPSPAPKARPSFAAPTAIAPAPARPLFHGAPKAIGIFK
jgi:hypothetical protein